MNKDLSVSPSRPSSGLRISRKSGIFENNADDFKNIMTPQRPSTSQGFSSFRSSGMNSNVKFRISANVEGSEDMIDTVVDNENIAKENEDLVINTRQYSLVTKTRFIGSRQFSEKVFEPFKNSGLPKDIFDVANDDLDSDLVDNVTDENNSKERRTSSNMRKEVAFSMDNTTTLHSENTEGTIPDPRPSSASPINTKARYNFNKSNSIPIFSNKPVQRTLFSTAAHIDAASSQVFNADVFARVRAGLIAGRVSDGRGSADSNQEGLRIPLNNTGKTRNVLHKSSSLRASRPVSSSSSYFSSRNISLKNGAISGSVTKMMTLPRGICVNDKDGRTSISRSASRGTRARSSSRFSRSSRSVSPFRNSKSAGTINGRISRIPAMPEFFSKQARGAVFSQMNSFGRSSISREAALGLLQFNGGDFFPGDNMKNQSNASGKNTNVSNILDSDETASILDTFLHSDAHETGKLLKGRDMFSSTRNDELEASEKQTEGAGIIDSLDDEENDDTSNSSPKKDISSTIQKLNPEDRTRLLAINHVRLWREKRQKKEFPMPRIPERHRAAVKIQALTRGFLNRQWSVWELTNKLESVLTKNKAREVLLQTENLENMNDDEDEEHLHSKNDEPISPQIKFPARPLSADNKRRVPVFSLIIVKMPN